MKTFHAFPKRRTPLRRLSSALFAMAVFGTGLAGAHAQSSPNALPSTRQPDSKMQMQHFVIIFRQEPRTFTEADLTRRQKEVSAWARAQNAAGHKLEPRILAPDVLRPGADTGNGNGTGPWPVTALLFLEARDLAEAGKVAESHPANHFGASVEVRPWAPPVIPAAPAPAPALVR
ncbi:MAG TPA: hypothetical protein VIT91_11905 [Chthoniobacterales bacterium]